MYLIMIHWSLKLKQILNIYIYISEQYDAQNNV
jgi:hypothetical protein